LHTVRIRPATVSDAEAIRSIYNVEVETTTATFDLVPRSLPDQEAWLLARTGAFAAVVAIDDSPTAHSGTDASPPGQLEPAGAVVGFASLSPYKERAAYRTSVEDSVYVRQDRHGAGIGRQLVTHMLDVAVLHGFHAVFARIEASGAASLALHRACGFEMVGIEREVGRKFGRWLDVAIMQCLLHERSGGPSGETAR
jgi:phosphinothricin acetyltransferase